MNGDSFFQLHWTLGGRIQGQTLDQNQESLPDLFAVTNRQGHKRRRLH